MERAGGEKQPQSRRGRSSVNVTVAGTDERRHSTRQRRPSCKARIAQEQELQLQQQQKALSLAPIKRLGPRGRAAVACKACRIFKRKCSGGRPCELCLKRGKDADCYYDDHDDGQLMATVPKTVKKLPTMRLRKRDPQPSLAIIVAAEIPVIVQAGQTQAPAKKSHRRTRTPITRDVKAVTERLQQAHICSQPAVQDQSTRATQTMDDSQQTANSSAYAQGMATKEQSYSVASATIPRGDAALSASNLHFPTLSLPFTPSLPSAQHMPQQNFFGGVGGSGGHMIRRSNSLSNPPHLLAAQPLYAPSPSPATYDTTYGLNQMYDNTAAYTYTQPRRTAFHQPAYVQPYYGRTYPPTPFDSHWHASTSELRTTASQHNSDEGGYGGEPKE